MAAPTTRRPLPALGFLVGLVVLTSIVWWRVLDRPGVRASATPSACPTPVVSVVPQPASVTLHVLNSTNRTGLARLVATGFSKLGFRVAPDVGNDTSGTIAGVAEIRYGPAAGPAARLLSFYLPGAKLVPGQESGGDVTISLGQKFVTISSPAAVKQSMAAAHVSQSPARAGRLVVTPTPSHTTGSTTASAAAKSCSSS
jgi:LytR cell envelope-related transcriptional attenuator